VTGSARSWWPRAALRRDEDLDLERKVSWLELFFDLVFVVVLSRLAHDLAQQPDLGHVLDFGLLFAAVFWSWNAFTFYTERFESDGLEHRFFVFAAMAAVAAMAVFTEGGLDVHRHGFVWAYLAVRAVNMAQWVRAGLHVPAFRPVALRFLGGFFLSAGCVVSAAQLDGTSRRWVFAAAVLTDVLTPVLTLKHQTGLPRLSTSKFPERFGLFTILVLGETVAGVITGVSGINEAGQLGIRQLLDGGLGLLIGIGLWWTYFDFIARRPPKPLLSTTLGWVYLHLLTLAAVTATGAAIRLAIGQSLDHRLSADVRYLLVGSVVTALAGLAALETTLARSEDEPTRAVLSPAVKTAVAGGLLAVGWVDLGWSTTALLSVIVGGLTVPAAHGATAWYSPKNARGTDYERSAP